MQKLTINNIEIIYEDYQIEKINYIKKIIKNNSNFLKSVYGNNLILTFIPLEDEKAIYIDNFDKFFEDIVILQFNSEKVRKSLDNPYILPSLYIEYLIRKNQDNNSLVKSNSNISNEELFSLIAYKYFSLNGNFEGFINYLKIRYETDKIISWLSNEYRFETYNYLLKMTIEFLKEYDMDFLENITVFLNNMACTPFDESYISNESHKLPLITAEELENLIFEFFDYINAPLYWRELYKELNDKNIIIFKKQNKNNINNSMCYVDSDNKLKIMIDTDNSIRVFESVIHEFVHYVASLKDLMSDTKVSVSEIPSIFFENLAIEFLEYKGYSEKDIKFLKNRRKQNNFNKYMELLPLFNDMVRYIKMGELLRQEKIIIWQNNFKVIEEMEQKIVNIISDKGSDVSLFTSKNIDIEKLVDDECDSLINTFILNGIEIVNGYQYILATMITNELLKKYQSNPNIISKMYDITSELSSTGLKDILKIFNIEELFTLKKKRDRF